jgi:hypothetical protein
MNKRTLTVIISIYENHVIPNDWRLAQMDLADSIIRGTKETTYYFILESNHDLCVIATAWRV